MGFFSEGFDLIEWLRRSLDDEKKGVGRIFNLGIQGLVFVSMILFAVETIQDLSPGVLRTLSWMNWGIIGIFTLEYGLRVLVAQRRWKYVFGFWGIVDLLAVLPFYLSIGVDLRGLRALRLLRVLIYFKLLRYNRGLVIIKKAFAMVYFELIIVLFAALFVLYLISMGIFYFEHQAQPEAFSNLFDCLWWAVVTLTTVGYGDLYPITVGGKIFTFCVLLFGVGMISVPTAIIASAFLQVRAQHDQDTE